MGIDFIIDLFRLVKYDVIMVMIDVYIKMTYFKSIILKGLIKEKWINVVDVIKIVYYYIFR